MLNRNEKLLSGVVVPTVTPLTSGGAVDEAALRLLLGRLLGAGVNALFVAGTTGEGPALPLAVRRRAVEVSCEVAAGKVPVVVAAMETSAGEILETSAHAARQGADAIAVAPPFYLSLGEHDIVRLVEMVDGESALPAYLYNVPYAHLPQFSLGLLRRTASLPRILGLKDSSGDFAQLCAAVEIYRDRPECSVLVGPERLIAAALRAGADGGVSGGANVFPRLYTGLYAAWQARDEAQVEGLAARVLQVEEQFYAVGDAESGLVRGLKAALAVQGICSPALVRPYLPASAEEQQMVRERLRSWQDVALQAAGPVQ